MERFAVRLLPSRVNDLKKKADEWSRDSGFNLSWADLLRHGIELVLNDKEPPKVGGIKRTNMETA